MCYRKAVYFFPFFYVYISEYFLIFEISFNLIKDSALFPCFLYMLELPFFANARDLPLDKVTKTRTDCEGQKQKNSEIKVKRDFYSILPKTLNIYIYVYLYKIDTLETMLIQV